MAGRRGRKIDPNSVTQRVLAELQDEQWKDTHELARVLGAPARRVRSDCGTGAPAGSAPGECSRPAVAASVAPCADREAAPED